MADAVIEYRDEDSDLVFRWHGGAYIDVGSYQQAGVPGIDEDDFHAFDVINVWDDEAENSYLEHEPEGGWPAWKRPFRIVLERFEARCQAWLADIDERSQDVDA